jgi:D-cysteine desulfhydrase
MGPRRWIPGGGATPAGVIGQFLGGLELAAQLPEPPDAIVAPLGSSGTVAGLALAMAALEWPTRVVGVRVASRIVASGWHAASLALRARHLVAPIVALPRVQVPLVVNGLGRGYGHPTARGEAARRDAARQGLVLDSTYGAKTFAALPNIAARGFRRVVFWHTFAAPAPVEPS